MDLTNLEHYAPYIVIVLMFIIQNNFFVRPEALERKHREISTETDKKMDGLETKIQQKYVEISAYKEFQNHIYSRFDEVIGVVDEIKAILLKRRKDD
jgi:guanylate kinase